VVHISFINLWIKLLWNLKMSYLTNFSIWLIEHLTNWLTDYLMTSDKHNSITAKAMGLISSLFNVTSIPRHACLSTAADARIVVLPMLTIPFPTAAKVTICSSANSRLHGRLTNCSDSRSVYHACHPILDYTENEV